MSSLTDDAVDLYEAWVSNPGSYSVKFTSFFQAYADILSRFRDKEVTIAEIGVLDSGSLLAWQKWFGNKATIIGIDANPDVKKFEKDNIKIEIGNQADPVFWEGFFARYPDVDIVIDDGGHQYFQQAITLFSILNYSQKQTLILFEDVHTSFFSNFANPNDEETFLDLMKQLVDNITLQQIFSKRYMNRWKKNIDASLVSKFRSIKSMSFYAGILSVNYDPTMELIPSCISNTDENNKKGLIDYRHHGDISGVTFRWPDPLKSRTVTFKGSTKSKTKKIVRIDY